MELKELNTVAFAPGVTSHFAASWSEDNKMCVLTSKGIHIFELIPNPRNSKCWLSSKRFWLKVPEIRPTTESGIDTDRIVWKLPQAHVYEMIMDPSLAPDLKHTKPTPPHIIQASWSPAGVLRHNRCLLAVVLNTGAVVLFGPRSWKWLVVCNLSVIWLKHCSQFWSEVEPTDPVEMQYDQLKKRTTSLKMTMVNWGQLKQDSCRFAVIHADARISVWEIAVMNDAQWDAADVQLIRVVDTKMSLPSAILCLSVGTVVGDIDGHISFLTNVFKDVPPEAAATPYVLWDEEDHIKVNAISSLPQSSELESIGNWIILAVKKTFVIVFLLNGEGQKLAVYVHRVGGLAISGLVPLSTEGVMVASHTGILCKLNIKMNKNNDIMVESENIQTSFKMKDVACYGMTCSRNQTIWAVVTSLCKLYDHLVLRKPGQVIFCSSVSEDDLSSCLVNIASKPLIDTGEFLELIRMNCSKNKTVPLLQNLLCGTEPYPCDVPRLQVELWLAHIKLSVLSNSGEDKDPQTELTQKYIAELEQLLQVLHVITALKGLKFASREKPLNMHEQMSAYLMDTWLRIFSSTASDSFADIINEALADPLSVTNEALEEKCAICNQDFPMSADYRISKCLNGHKLPRCSQSLRQCTRPPYFLCPTPGCGATAHKDCGKPILCIYCSATLQLDERVGGGWKPVPAIYRIIADSTNVRTESTKVSSDRSVNKNKPNAVSDEFIEKHTFIIQMKEGSKNNVNDSKSASIEKK